MRRSAPFILPLLVLASPACSEDDDAGVSIETHTERPERREFTESLLASLKAPPGFEVSVVATGLANPRMLAVLADGSIYVTQPKTNNVVLLRDTDGDGRADETREVASNLEGVHGIAVRGDEVYLAGPSILWVAIRDAEGSLGAPEVVLDDLPDGGQHPNRTMAFGPDGALYLSIGSDCNACRETNPEHATIVRADLERGTRAVFARGLRNTLGFAWHPTSGELWGMDQGSDDRGDDRPPEELNHLRQDGDYGWPYAFAKREVDPVMDDPPGTTKAAYAPTTEPSALEYQAHSSPIGFVFYTADQYPAEWRGSAFITFRGSWNREPTTGYKVVRVRFEGAEPVAFEDFVTGWLIEDGHAHFGRIAGLAIDADGSLLVSEDTNGVVYRIRYREQPPA